MRDIVELTISGDLDSLIRKPLSEVVGLLQVYSRLAELEVASGEAPRFPGKGYVALPDDTAERIREWAESGREKVRGKEEPAGELSAAMQAQGYDAGALKAVLDG